MTYGSDWRLSFTNMTLYVETHKESSNTFLDLIKKFGNVSGYKINNQKMVVFLYINNEFSERN